MPDDRIPKGVENESGSRKSEFGFDLIHVKSRVDARLKLPQETRARGSSSASGETSKGKSVVHVFHVMIKIHTAAFARTFYKCSEPRAAHAGRLTTQNSKQ